MAQALRAANETTLPEGTLVARVWTARPVRPAAARRRAETLHPALRIGPRHGALVQPPHLRALQLAHRLAHFCLPQVERAQLAARDLGDGFDPHEVVSEAFGVIGEGDELVFGIGEVVAVGVDDGDSEGAVAAFGDDDEVGLERRPVSGVALVGDAQRRGGGAARVPVPGDEALALVNEYLRPPTYAPLPGPL